MNDQQPTPVRITNAVGAGAGAAIGAFFVLPLLLLLGTCTACVGVVAVAAVARPVYVVFGQATGAVLALAVGGLGLAAWHLLRRRRP